MVSADGLWEEGDSFYLMTDALAKTAPSAL